MACLALLVDASKTAVTAHTRLREPIIPANRATGYTPPDTIRLSRKFPSWATRAA